jgi:adenylate kinase family enzyme
MKEGLIILGAPFSGKNTVAEKLALQENISHIDAGLLVREKARIDKVIKDLTSQGLQLPSEISCKLVMEELDKLVGNTTLINGFPRQKINAERISQVFSPWAVIVLDIALEEIYRRHDISQEREDRIDHGRDILIQRLQSYFSQDTKEVQEYYSGLGLLKIVDGNRKTENVFNDVNCIYQSLKR